MISTLEARKASLLSQIEKLKREIEVVKWPEDKELAFLYCTSSIKFLDFYRLQVSSKN